jgi:hypothetical protein
MSKNDDALLINNVIKKNVFKLFAIYFELSECAEKNCSAEKKNIMANKNAADLYTNYKTEKNIKKKIELGEQYSENDLIYEYNKCLMKHCNKILNNLIILIKSIISTMPKSNSKQKNLDKMISELEILFKKHQLTKKEFKTYVKNMAELMLSIDKPS